MVVCFSFQAEEIFLAPDGVNAIKVVLWFSSDFPFISSLSYLHWESKKWQYSSTTSKTARTNLLLRQKKPACSLRSYILLRWPLKCVDQGLILFQESSRELFSCFHTIVFFLLFTSFLEEQANWNFHTTQKESNNHLYQHCFSLNYNFNSLGQRF